MVSLAQAQAVQKLEAEGWMIVEPSNKRANSRLVTVIGRPLYRYRVAIRYPSHQLCCRSSFPRCEIYRPVVD